MILSRWLSGGLCVLLAVCPAGVPAGMAQGPAASQQPGQPVNRPFAARRVVYQFDFEPDAREVFEIPRYWDLAQDGSRATGSRPGFPSWNSAAFDDTMAFAGSRSVRLSTKGGSVSLRLEPGVIPIFPGTEYLVSARILTRGLKHARAGLIARYLDKTNKPIGGAWAGSERVVSGDGPDWMLVTATLPGDVPDAAYIQIDLEVLQPEQFAHAEHDKHQVWQQDFAGSAWFDQVAVVQLPRAAIATPSPINILRSPERPRVSVMLRDLTGEQITGTFTLQDAAGTTIDEMTRHLGGGAGGGSTGAWDWEPKVTDFGWYRATLELRNNQRRVGATYIDLAWLPAQNANVSSDVQKFSVILNELPPDRRVLLPELLSAMTGGGAGAGGGGGGGGGAVTIPVWSADSTPAGIERLCQDLIPIIERLRAANQEVAFSLPRLPDALATQTRLEADNPLWAFAADEKVWGPYLVPLLDKYGQSVQRWQIGSIGRMAASVESAPAAAARAGAVLSRLVPGPIVELPWSADQARQSFEGADVELLAAVPAGVSGAGLADLASMWAAVGNSPAPTLVLSELPSEFSRLDSCISMVKQAVMLWTAREGVEPPTLAVVEPWHWSGPSDGPPMPRAELAAWANLGERLRDRRAAGSLEPRAGVTCIILAPSMTAASTRTGALAMWADSADVGVSHMDVYLGEGPVDVVDIFGNRRSVAPTPVIAPAGPAGAARSARVPMAHRLPISESPVFIENVDVDLARFAASFKLDPAFAATSTNEHEIAMVLSNPWKHRVEGRITVLEPGGLSTDAAARDRSWRITPRSSAFSIGPGETSKVPIAVAFSPVEEAGPKDFLVEVELVGTRDYAPIRLHTTLEVGVTDFHLDLSYRIVNGTDIAIEAQVTNRGAGASNFELSGFADGYPRAKAYISDLPVGALATRRFSFPGGAVKLKGQRIAVGVQDVSTQSRVTRSVLIE